MSHDIRTPLNGIIGMTYLAQKETDPAIIKEHLEKIETSANSSWI
jgi:signal transduction histidine kinase